MEIIAIGQLAEYFDYPDSKLGSWKDLNFRIQTNEDHSSGLTRDKAYYGDIGPVIDRYEKEELQFKYIIKDSYD